jgi:hypothetical protein
VTVIIILLTSQAPSLRYLSGQAPRKDFRSIVGSHKRPLKKQISAAVGNGDPGPGFVGDKLTTLVPRFAGSSSPLVCCCDWLNHVPWLFDPYCILFRVLRLRSAREERSGRLSQ